MQRERSCFPTCSNITAVTSKLGRTENNLHTNDCFGVADGFVRPQASFLVPYSLSRLFDRTKMYEIGQNSKSQTAGEQISSNQAPLLQQEQGGSSECRTCSNRDLSVFNVKLRATEHLKSNVHRCASGGKSDLYSCNGVSTEIIRLLNLII